MICSTTTRSTWSSLQTVRAESTPRHQTIHISIPNPKPTLPILWERSFSCLIRCRSKTDHLLYLTLLTLTTLTYLYPNLDTEFRWWPISETPITLIHFLRPCVHAHAITWAEALPTRTKTDHRDLPTYGRLKPQPTEGFSRSLGSVRTRGHPEGLEPTPHCSTNSSRNTSFVTCGLA